MAGSESQADVIYVINHRLGTGGLVMRLYSIPIGVLLIYIAYRLIPAPLGYAPESVAVILIVYSLYVSNLAYQRSRRIEFHEGFLRVIPHRGRPAELPYSQLMFKVWTRPSKRGGTITVGAIYIRGEEDKLLPSFADPSGGIALPLPCLVLDGRIAKLDTTLFQWLATKMGEPSDEMMNEAEPQMRLSAALVARRSIYAMIFCEIAAGSVLIIFGGLLGATPPLGFFVAVIGLILLGMGLFYLWSVRKKSRELISKVNAQSPVPPPG